MVPRTEPPQQYKQLSRKGKKAWRKNVDVSEVQSGLESAREEIIKGGIVAEKPSHELFTIDATGSEAIKKAYNKVHKPLKADQILAQRSAVPAVDTRKRGVTDGVLEPSSKRRKANGVSFMELERLKKRAYGGDALPSDVLKPNDTPEHDPWAEVVEVNDQRFSFLEKPKSIRAPNSLKQPPISLIEGKKDIPAVLKPKPGTSYNPSFQDWDELLTKEGEKEVAAELKRIEEAKSEAAKQALISAAQNERDIFLVEDDSAWEGFESDYETADWLKKKRPERKTPAERNKIKRRKEAERHAKHLAEMKRRAKQAKQIQDIGREVKARVEAEAKNQNQLAEADAASSDDEIDDQALRRRRLGKAPIQERNLELVLPDELRDSLRLLKPEGNLLKDRFRSILVRGKVEARNPIQQPKKVKRSYTEKWTYKDFTIAA